MPQQIAVIGLGRFGSRLASQLADSGADVIAVDRDRDLVQQMRDQVALAVAMDSTDEAALRAQGLGDVDVAVVGIGADFEATALTTVLLKQIGVPRVIARAATAMSAQILTRIGADMVVNPEEESALLWCNRLLMTQFLSRHMLGDRFSMVQMRTPRPWVDKTLAELNPRKGARVNVVAIRHASEDTDSGKAGVFALPDPLRRLGRDDVLVIVGSDENLEALPAPDPDAGQPSAISKG